MNYTILKTDVVFTNESVNLDKNGNKYTVGIYNSESKQYSHRDFDTIEEALAKYSRIVELYGLSLYTEEQKRQILLHDTPIKHIIV